MWIPVLISENRMLWGPIHVRPEALPMRGRGSPPSNGTTKLLKARPWVTVYTTREPSGETTDHHQDDGRCRKCHGIPWLQAEEQR